jgi:hypothetical protein
VVTAAGADLSSHAAEDVTIRGREESMTVRVVNDASALSL